MAYEFQPGERLDHYLLGDCVANKGMASIFRGVDLHSGITVAIKIPHPDAEDASAFFSRFQREIDIGKRLDHPGVVKVLGNGDGQSRPYMVMEWLEGRRLRSLLEEEGKIPLDRAVRIAVGICEALDYLHSQGIVHRDLKPENVMVDADDEIKLFDFGIASLEGARRLTYSRIGPTLGTPDYISPEQVRGQRGDARSDVYALGAMLYEMVTGATPFNGPSPIAIMQDRLLNDPIPPRERNPAIPAALQEVVYHALERDPRKRYADTRSLAWDLQHLDEVGVTERAELQSWKRRRDPRGRLELRHVMLMAIPVAVLALFLLVVSGMLRTKNRDWPTTEKNSLPEPPTPALVVRTR
jgi:serine/threonine protein kinase